MNLLSIKAVKIYKVIAVILALSVLAVFMYLAYENYMHVKKQVNELDYGIDNIVQEWTVDVAKDAEMLNQIDKDLYEAQIRLRILYKKAGLEYE